MSRHSYIVGLTGGSGSGKTTFIREIRNRFSLKELCIVSQDDYYKPREQQVRDDQGYQNFDLPGSILYDDLLRDLRLLMRGEVVRRMEYTFNNEKAEPGLLKFEPAPILLVEGLFIMHFEEIRNLFDLKVFIDAHDVLKVKRRILRDREERNYPVEDVLYRYEHHVLPAYSQFIEPYKDFADLIITNNDNFDRGLDVMTGFFQQYLLSAAV